MPSEFDIEIQQLTEERNKLVAEKLELTQNLASLGISGNRSYFARGTIEKDVWDKRTEWASRVAKIEKRLTEIKPILRKKQFIKIDIVRVILTETFGVKFMSDIMVEVERRVNDEHPIRVSPPNVQIKEAKTYELELKKALDTMLSARQIINDYISDNEPSINKAEYFLSVQKLNRSLPPITEIKKMYN